MKNFPLSNFVEWATKAQADFVALSVRDQIIVYVLLLAIKFFGTYLLMFHNGSFIPLDNLRVVFIAPVILIIIAPILIKGAAAIIKMNS